MHDVGMDERMGAMDRESEHISQLEAEIEVLKAFNSRLIKALNPYRCIECGEEMKAFMDRDLDVPLTAFCENRKCSRFGKKVTLSIPTRECLAYLLKQMS